MFKVKLNQVRWDDDKQYVGGTYDAFKVKSYDYDYEYAIKVADDKILYVTPGACETLAEDAPALKVKIKSAKDTFQQPYVGGIYEAFKMVYSDRYDYCAQVSEDQLMGFKPDQVEVIGVEIVGIEAQTSEPTKKILLVEDGSVDVDDLEEWCGQNGIKLVVYSQGAAKPEFLEY